MHFLGAQHGTPSSSQMKSQPKWNSAGLVPFNLHFYFSTKVLTMASGSQLASIKSSTHTTMCSLLQVLPLLYLPQSALGVMCAIFYCHVKICFTDNTLRINALVLELAGRHFFWSKEILYLRVRGKYIVGCSRSSFGSSIMFWVLLPPFHVIENTRITAPP